jgi:hypothetical protein
MAIMMNVPQIGDEVDIRIWQVRGSERAKSCQRFIKEFGGWRSKY